MNLSSQLEQKGIHLHVSVTMTIRKLTQAKNVHKNGSVASLLVANI